jgi:hypothetical protein
MRKIKKWYKTSFFHFMKKQGGLKILLIISSLFLIFEVRATPIYVNEMGEGTSYALGLQNLIDERGNTLVNINSDQLDSGVAAAWTGNVSISASMVVEVAGSAALNSFGIYHIADPSQKTQVFSGSVTGGGTASLNSPYTSFGFYLINAALGFTWYSDPSLNGGQAHMVTYQGKGETLNLGNDAGNPLGSVNWDSHTYLLGWEDQDLNNSDQDYNDMLVLVSFQPVPDHFLTVGLFGAAMLGLAFFKTIGFNRGKRWVNSAEAPSK